MSRARYCSCPRGRYEAHCAEQRLDPVCPPQACGRCVAGVLRPAFDPAAVAVAISPPKTPRPRDADGNPLLLALLVGEEPGRFPGRLDVTVAAGGLELGAHVNFALSQPAALARIRAAFERYRRANGAEAAFLVALYGTACSVVCRRGNPPADAPWWTLNGTVGELLYGPSEDAS